MEIREDELFDMLISRVFPFIKKQYELMELKQKLRGVERVRQRLQERIKQLEKEVGDKNERPVS